MRGVGSMGDPTTWQLESPEYYERASDSPLPTGQHQPHPLCYVLACPIP